MLQVHDKKAVLNAFESVSSAKFSSAQCYTFLDCVSPIISIWHTAQNGLIYKWSHEVGTPPKRPYVYNSNDCSGAPAYWQIVMCELLKSVPKDTCSMQFF